VLPRLPKLLIALALALSIGVHWTVLQVVAWTGMVISYSQDAPLAQAVVKTFDGKHPCNLCKKIANGKRSEKKSEYQFEAGKVKFANAAVSFVFSAPMSYWEVGERNDTPDLLAHAPPIPPPRACLG
jgi:hypothetical protein